MARRKQKNNIDDENLVGSCGTCLGLFISTALVVGIVKQIDETFGVRNVLIFVVGIIVLITFVKSAIEVMEQRRNPQLDDEMVDIVKNYTAPYLWKKVLSIDGLSFKDRIDKYNLQKQVIDTPEFGRLYLEAAMLLTRDEIKDRETLRNVLGIDRKQTEELLDRLQRGHIVINVSDDEIESISYQSFSDYLKNPYVLYDNKKIYFAKGETHYGTVIEGNKQSSFQNYNDVHRPNVPANIDSYFYRQNQNLLITSSNTKTDISLLSNAFCIVNEDATVLFTINPGKDKVNLVNNNYIIFALDVISDLNEGASFLDFLLQEIEWRENQFDRYEVSDISVYNKQFRDSPEKKYIYPQIDRILVIIFDAETYLKDCTEDAPIFRIINRGNAVGVQTILTSRLTSEQIISDNTTIPISTVEASQVQSMISEVNLCVHRSITGDRSKDRIYPLSAVIKFINDEQTCQKIKNGIPTNEYIPVSIVMSAQLSGKETGNMIINNTSYQKTLREVDQMTGTEFEHFCKDILSKNGFKEIFVTKASGDYGADLIAKKDGIKYVIQCKRYSGNVGEDSVRQVYASKKVYDAEIAVVLTNSHFTDAAFELAKHNQVHLWHRKKLMLLMKEANENQSCVL